MHLHVNARRHELPDGAPLSALMASIAPEPRGIAVAVNGCVVRGADWPATTLREGDSVEVVTAHQGG